MRRDIKLEVLLVDDSIETVTCTMVYVKEGCLHAYRDVYYGAAEHVASWPLTNIKKWVQSDV